MEENSYIPAKGYRTYKLEIAISFRTDIEMLHTDGNGVEWLQRSCNISSIQCGWTDQVGLH